MRFACILRLIPAILLGLFVVQTAEASTWNPSVLVNTEGFQTIDDTDAAANLEIRFGDSLNEKLLFDRSNVRFKLTKGLYVSGGMVATGSLLVNIGRSTAVAETELEVIGTASGRTLHAHDFLQSSGALIVEGAVTLSTALTVPNGGTGFGTCVDGGFVTGNAAGILTCNAILTDDQIYVGDGTTEPTALTLPDCDNATSSKLLYDQATNAFSCGTDQGGAGGGITISEGDGTFVNQAGDGMTGALLIKSGNPKVLADAGLLLEIVGTASGRRLHAQDSLTTSGTLRVDEGATLSGTITLRARGNPSGNPDADTMWLFSRKINGRIMLKAEGASGVDYPYQPALFQNQIIYLYPNTTTTFGTMGGMPTTNSATLSHPTATQALGYNTNFATSTTSGNESGFISANAQFWRGSTAGTNGWFLFARVVVIDTALVRIKVGFHNQTTLANLMASDNIASAHTALWTFSTARGDTTWKMELKDGTTQNVVDSGIPVSASNVYDLFLYTPPFGATGAGTMYWRVDNVTAGTTAEGSTASNLPGGSTALRYGMGVETQTTAAKSFRMNRVYIETDR